MTTWKRCPYCATEVKGLIAGDFCPYCYRCIEKKDLVNKKNKKEIRNITEKICLEKAIKLAKKEIKEWKKFLAETIKKYSN